MINVIATMDVKPECLDELVKIFKANIPAVLAEDGCIRYELCKDVESGLPPQIPNRPNTLVVVETWASMDALKAHLQTPHMKAFGEKAKDMRNGVSLQVLGEA